MSSVHRTLVVLSCSLLAGAGCNSDAPRGVDDPPVPTAATDQAGQHEAVASESEASEASVSGFRFKVPPGWRRAELTSAQQGFVDARFEIPEYGEDVRLTLSTTGGGVEANLDRWIGQFRLSDGTAPRRESLDVDGLQVTWIDLSGEFQGMGQSPQPGWRMLGAAFDGEPRDFYIKLTGPEAAVAALHDEFRQFVTSARRERR